MHPSLKVDLEEMTKHADWMKLSRKEISEEGRRHWKAPYNSVLGDNHYHKVSKGFPLVLWLVHYAPLVGRNRFQVPLPIDFNKLNTFAIITEPSLTWPMVVLKRKITLLC